MSSKEKFEAWRISIGDDPISMTKMDDENYLYGWTRMHWNTWQACEASREFVVDLPIPFSVDALGIVFERDDIIEAIEAAGGRVK